MNRDKLRARVRNGASWYRIRNQAGTGGEPAVVVIYDEIGYWGVSAQDFMVELRSITASEIELRINSPGGEIFDGIAIHNVLRSHQARVTTYVDSLAASIASVIAMAGDRIVMQPHSQLMIHDGSGLCIGDAADMREMADLLDRQSDNIAGIYAERAGGGAAKWRKAMQAETWYTAAEAVEAGLADEVAKLPRRDDADPDLTDRWDLTLFTNYPGRPSAAADPPPAEPPPPPPAPPDSPDGEEPGGLGSAAPAPVVAFDPDVFRLAVAKAAESPFEFDAEGFRQSLAALTEEAPAVTASAPTPDPVDDGDEESEPEPEPTAGELLAETLMALTTEAPATPTARATAPDSAPAPPPPAAAAEPAPDPWAAVTEVFAAAVALEANRAPAPTTRAPQPSPETEVVDGWTFQRALKEAVQ